MLKLIMKFSNNDISQLTSHYEFAVSSEKKHISFLKNLFASNQTKFDLATSKGGFKPVYHAETELFRRINDAGYGRHLIPRAPVISDSEYQDALDRGEDLMSKIKTPRFNKKHLIAASCSVLNEIRKFIPHKLVPLTPTESSESLNFVASSGFPYYQRKGKVLSNLLADYFNVPIDELRSWPTNRSFRAQLQLEADKIVPRVRVIYPFPGTITLMEMRFVKPIIDILKVSDSFYMTGKSGGFISDKITSLDSKYNHNFSSDISKFDQNMPNEVIHASFGVVRRLFSLSKNDMREIEFIEDYFSASFLSSRVGTTEGNSIIKVSGIPSGSGFTNLVGTLCHAIILAYYDLDWFNKHTSFICGDDNLTFTNDRMEIEDIRNIYTEVWKLPVKEEECDFNTGINNLYFLGFTWLKGVRVINPRIALNQLVYHTSFLTDLDWNERILARSASVLLNGANGRIYFEKILPELMPVIKQVGIDINYVFLHGYAPPVTREKSIIASDKIPKTYQSLTEHFYNGWRIR